MNLLKLGILLTYIVIFVWTLYDTVNILPISDFEIALLLIRGLASSLGLVFLALWNYDDDLFTDNIEIRVTTLERQVKELTKKKREISRL